MNPSGFLNVYKPTGLTSHKCVGIVRQVFDTRQIGHGGTLDPIATGVLTVAVGRATRFLQYLTTGKEYRGMIRFGVTTDSDDITGEILTQQPAPWINEEMLHLIMKRFSGHIDQIPPRVSAIKKNGVRLYKLARAKKDFDIKPRQVHIEQIEVQKFVPGSYPEVEIRVVCGGGTYIRSIARECGEALVVPLDQISLSYNLRNLDGDFCAGGTLTELERTRSGIFTITDSLNFDDIRTKVEQGQSLLQPIESMLQHLPSVDLPLHTAQRWLHGGIVTIPPDAIDTVDHKLFSGKSVRIYRSSSPELLGIAQVHLQAQHKEFILKKRLFI